MLRYEASTNAPPAAAWALLARPDRWKEWAPHLRGAWGLGQPEVLRDHLGAARLLGVVPVPARIVDKDPGRSWEWRVGVIDMDHRVEPTPGGCLVAVTLQAPAPVEAVLKVTYGPLVQVLVRRLADVSHRA